MTNNKDRRSLSCYTLKKYILELLFYPQNYFFKGNIIYEPRQIAWFSIVASFVSLLGVTDWRRNVTGVDYFFLLSQCWWLDHVVPWCFHLVLLFSWPLLRSQGVWHLLTLGHSSPFCWSIKIMCWRQNICETFKLLGMVKVKL